MTIALPQKVEEKHNITGQVTSDNNLTARLDGSPTLNVKVANVGLALSNVILTNAGLGADATWDLTKIGGGKPGAGKVRIDNTAGLSFNGAQEFVFGSTQQVSVGGFDATVRKAGLEYASATKSYNLALTGKVTIRASNGPSASADMTAKFGQKGLRDAAVKPFTLAALAGLDFKVKAAIITGQGLSASQVDLKAPREWGGLAAPMSGLRITSDGALSVTSGRFKLPTIKAGDGFSLTGLSGSFNKASDGSYRIAADGEFKLPVGEGSGSCVLNVGVTFRTATSQARVLEIGSAGSSWPPAAPGAAEAASVPIANVMGSSPDGLALNRIALGVWNCPARNGIPIDGTGFRLTGVRGEVQLNHGIERVQVEIQVKSELGIGNKPLLSAEAAATIETRPWALEFAGKVYAAGLKTNETEVRISKKDGFSARLLFDYVVFHADLKVDTWARNGKLYITGSGKAYVKIEKGKFGRECVDLWPKDLCVSIPPFGFKTPTVKGEFGTFKNGDFGLKGSFEYEFKKWGKTLLSFRGGFYVDADGDLDVGNVDQYQLATRPKVQEALRQRDAVARGEMLAVAAEYAFLDLGTNGEVQIKVPVTGPGADWLAAPSDRMEPITVTQRSDLIFAMTQPAAGALIFSLLDPAGAVLTPDDLPDNAGYWEDIGEDGRQSNFLVANAAAGVWRAQIGGDTANTDYIVMALGNTPAPALDGLSLAPAGQPDRFDAGWRLWSTASDVTVSLYANSGPITQTFTLTDTLGAATAEVADVFNGIPLAVNLNSATDGRPQQHRLDLSALSSGQYHIWLEADDGRNPPMRGYLLRDGAPALVVVDRTASFPAGWAATISVAEGPAPDQLSIEWQANPHPDVDNYRVRLRSSDPVSPTEELDVTYLVGDNLSYVAGGILPGRAYSISVGAENSQAARIAWSQEESIAINPADFIFRLAGGEERVYVIPAGAQAAVPVELELPPDALYPVGLAAGYEYLPDGFEVSFPQEVVTTTVTVTANVAASAALEEGTYVVPLVATNGFVTHELAVVVEVGPLGYGLYLPLVLRDYSASSSALTDPAGDWLPGAEQLASADIRAASIERRPAEGVVIFTMTLAGPLPPTLPADERNRWVWLLDTDQNAATGDPWRDLGVEYEVNLHIQWDGFYADVRDWHNNWTSVPGAVTIEGDRVTLRIPVSTLGGATRFSWMAVVEPFDREGTRFDIAPNSGYAQLP